MYEFDISCSTAASSTREIEASKAGDGYPHTRPKEFNRENVWHYLHDFGRLGDCPTVSASHCCSCADWRLTGRRHGSNGCVIAATTWFSMEHRMALCRSALSPAPTECATPTSTRTGGNFIQHLSPLCTSTYHATPRRDGGLSQTDRTRPSNGGGTAVLVD